MLLHDAGPVRIVAADPEGTTGMRQIAVSAALALALVAAAGPAAAGCFADYKAKREPPLQLHYGVIELPAAVCGDRAAAAAEIARRIGRDGWSLLDLVAIFGSQGLAGRERDAGQFFLRY